MMESLSFLMMVTAFPFHWAFFCGASSRRFAPRMTNMCKEHGHSTSTRREPIHARAGFSIHTLPTNTSKHPNTHVTKALDSCVFFVLCCLRSDLNGEPRLAWQNASRGRLSAAGKHDWARGYERQTVATELALAWKDAFGNLGASINAHNAACWRSLGSSKHDVLEVGCNVTLWECLALPCHYRAAPTIVPEMITDTDRK